MLKDARYTDSGGYQQWLEDMRDGKQPGNHISLQAFANLYLAQIHVLDSTSGRVAIISPFTNDTMLDVKTTWTIGLLPGHKYVSLIPNESK